MRDAIMRLLEPQAEFDAQGDPRAAAFRIAQRRNQDRNRAQMAESAAQTGLTGTGGFEGALRGLNQQRAESEAAFEAGLSGERYAERRDDLQRGLTLAMARGDRDAQISLQRELALLEADTARRGLDTQRYGIDISADLDRRGQDTQRYGIDVSADLDRRDQGLRRYGLDLSDRQSRDRLGFDYASLTELANRQAVLAALGYA